MPTITELPSRLKSLQVKTMAGLLPSGQAHIFHAQGIEHVPQHRLLFSREIADGLPFQDRQEIDDFFGLREIDGHRGLLRVEFFAHEHQGRTPQ